MAVSTVTFQTYGGERGFNPMLRKREFIGRATVGAGTYQTNGLPLTWALTDYQGNAVLMPRSNVAETAFIYSIGGSSNVYQYDSINGTLRIVVAGAELANGATVPAGVTGDVIEFRGVFAKFQL